MSSQNEKLLKLSAFWFPWRPQRLHCFKLIFRFGTESRTSLVLGKTDFLPSHASSSLNTLFKAETMWTWHFPSSLLFALPFILNSDWGNWAVSLRIERSRRGLYGLRTSLNLLNLSRSNKNNIYAFAAAVKGSRRNEKFVNKIPRALFLLFHRHKFLDLLFIVVRKALCLMFLFPLSTYRRYTPDTTAVWPLPTTPRYTWNSFSTPDVYQSFNLRVLSFQIASLASRRRKKEKKTANEHKGFLLNPLAQFGEISFRRKFI